MLKRVPLIILFALFMALGISSSAVANTTPESGRSHSKVTSVAFKVVKQKGWVGVQQHIVPVTAPKINCEWFEDFWNSNYMVGSTSKTPYMYEDHNGYLCRDNRSPTGWVKRDGGHTGSDCGNIAQPPYEKPKYPVVKPPILEINSLSELKVTVKVTVKASASINLSCGAATGTGFAYDFIKVKYSTYIKSKRSKRLKLRLAAKVIAKAKDRAEATAEVQCNGSPPPCHSCPPPGEPPCTTCPPPPCTGTPEQCNPKDGEPGTGEGTPGQPGGGGSGGEPAPPDATGEICRTENGEVGYKDQFGYCNPY